MLGETSLVLGAWVRKSCIFTGQWVIVHAPEQGGSCPPYPGDADVSRAIFNPLIAELPWMGVLGVGRAALLPQF